MITASFTFKIIPTQSQNFNVNKIQCIWQVLEAVLTDFHLETDTRVTSIHEQLKETQLMLEDEVERLEEYFGDKVMEAEMRLDEKFEKVWGETGEIGGRDCVGWYW